MEWTESVPTGSQSWGLHHPGALCACAYLHHLPWHRGSVSPDCIIVKLETTLGCFVGPETSLRRRYPALRGALAQVYWTCETLSPTGLQIVYPRHAELFVIHLAFQIVWIPRD